MALQDLPWDVISGGSAVVSVITVVIWLTRNHGTQARQTTKLFADTVKDSNEKFAEVSASFANTVKVQGERCDTNTAMLLREHRDAAAERERVLIEALKEFSK